MKCYRKIGALLLCLIIMCTSCGTSEKEEKVEKTEVLTYTEGNITYDVIEKPEEANGPRMANKYVIIHGTEHPRMILKLLEKDTETFEYIEYQLQEDFSWQQKKTSWSDEVAKKSPKGIGVMVSDSKGVLYASAYDKDNKYVVYRLDEDGKVQELNIKEVLSFREEKEISSFDIINDHQLVFFFSENSSEIGAECDVAIYDLLEEQVTEQGSTVSVDVVFDEEGNYYSLSSAQQLIQKYSIHDSLPSKVIQCDGISPITGNFDILIEDDMGYIKTGKGIYGGGLDAERWNVIIPIKDMYYNKEIEMFQLQPLNAFSSFLKVPGNDAEFFVETFRDEKSVDFDWVHYRDN